MLLNPTTGAISIYICLAPTDMRCSFDKLASLVQQVICQNPLSGHLFVFVSKRRTMLKILFWDRTGYCQYFKRLESGTFAVPSPSEGQTPSLPITFDVLQLLLDGIDVLGAKRSS